jgi:prevent-host-death family protein
VVRPVPIPNTAVKHSLADGSGLIDSARVGRRQPFIKAEISARNFGFLAPLPNVELQLKVKYMKTVTMLEFRKDAEGILRRVAKGERFLLSHRGRPAARLEPVSLDNNGQSPDDPFLTIGRRAVPGPKGKTCHADIDRIIYGRP